MRFSTVLVANRGEIARRIIRAARERGLVTVAVYVAADADAPFIADADRAVLLTTTYLDGDALIAAALSSGAEAIHPGYGFLSESAAFAAAVEAVGLVWIGPPSRVIASMGDKLEAKKLALATGLPVLSSSDDPAGAASVGFPLMIKAAAGGGGKGMRVVAEPSDLADAIAAARREAEASFGEGRVFFERYIPRSRHVEIQILGDRHGHLVHLGERECSIQRRHQKLIEESPSPALSEAARHAIGRRGDRPGPRDRLRVRRYRRVLGRRRDGRLLLLEVNARLQVEHPVSEEVTGIDLVESNFAWPRARNSATTKTTSV